MPEVKVKIEGDEEYIAALRRFPKVLTPAVEAAGREFGAEILDTEGVQAYPASSKANQPPEPYYVRGTGTQHSPGYNDMKSEKYGTKFDVRAEGYATTIENTASYAGPIGGEDQAEHMAALGWRKLADVAKEKLDTGKKIYIGWINRALQQAGLK